ncbi:hypothetical protein RYX56_12960 [Alkalihalophilus lindianensis]|uniref:Small peptidoglycan-associated lipoprotein n=1 Tax=Alkalihalophilus lindianensis TaxID=1630542 RepID=A0ABU3XBL2_9BACI|nr:hypothetical protein [Alkalihalophilus lindianensis]MDV2685266.1 hypothetical protein [Alkalihalophilus lindianensis]
MEKLFLSMLFAPIFMLSNCVSSAQSDDTIPPSYTESTMITILFSDAKALEEEHSYYDALLELQTQHPDKIPSFQVVDAEDKDRIKQFEIDTFPTMLILTGEDIHLRMEGPQAKDDILTKLNHTFQIQMNHIDL